MVEETIQALEDWRRKLEASVGTEQKLPSHRMGVHWIADLVRDGDKSYMASLSPAVIKIVNPSRDRVLEAFRWVQPHGHVALRYHPISEQQAELAADPVGLGRKHADYWRLQMETTYKEFDRSRLYVMGINEPTVHNADQERKVAQYTEAFLRSLKAFNIRAYVFNFSVGWPREVDGEIVWDSFKHLEGLINETNSFGCVHEYWYPNVMEGWNSYANRISRCPLEIPFVIGECAYTRQVKGLPQPYGWDGNISASAYADQLWEYHDKVDPGKVFAICPFTTSYGGLEWRNKDTLPAASEILRRNRKFSWPVPWPQYRKEPPAMDLKTVWPRMDRITQWYGGTHSGLDISMPTGTPLYAMHDGIVAWSGIDAGGYGEYLRINLTSLGFDQFVAHLSNRIVRQGERVSRGQLLGHSGNTGNSTGPHLHLECRMKLAVGSFVDRSGVGPFHRGQVDPMAIKCILQNLFGIEER
jgi:murein DD-endopeptidase MepM/ murein hydrolase activator NlpD